MNTPFQAGCKGAAAGAAVRRHLAGSEAATRRNEYPEAVNLPFNFSSISDAFHMTLPGAEETTEPGYWAVIQGNSLLTVQTDGSPALPVGSLPAWLQPKHPPICIGTWLGKPLRAFVASSNVAAEPPFAFEPFNAGVQSLDIRTLTIGGLAKQVLHWQRMSRYCSICGSETGMIAGTWGRKCPSCKAEHFPHIHSCAIVLVRRGDLVLLTRKLEWSPNRYSLVAGFLDFGESLEECAAREVKEETGITVRNVRYVGSQNWPFPSQVMAGFVADYAAGEIQVDRSELDDAQWFDVNALPDLPPSRSIARWIIDNHAR